MDESANCNFLAPNAEILLLLYELYDKDFHFSHSSYEQNENESDLMLSRNKSTAMPLSDIASLNGKASPINRYEKLEERLRDLGDAACLR